MTALEIILDFVLSVLARRGTRAVEGFLADFECVPIFESYVAFDLIWLNGVDLRPLPLRERRERLQAILPSGMPTIIETVSVEAPACQLYDLMCENDLEGIVAKRLGDPYEPRVRWLKIKNPAYSQKEGRSALFNGPRQTRRSTPSSN